jgi:chromosomal replication initiation ATPase DnaA
MSRQLSFALPAQVALGPSDFFTSPANAGAFQLVTTGQWPLGKLVLTGPAGAGKSHLVRVWQGMTGGQVVAARSLAEMVRAPPGAQVAVEDADHLPQAAEEALFHLHNHLAATGGRLLITARTPPARWTVALPDLASRLQATTVVSIADPDDALLFAVIAKHFADRQLHPAPDVVPYLATRIERSFAAAAAVVARIDTAALAAQRPVTRAFVRAILDHADP